MSADFISEPPAEDLFDTPETEPAVPADADFLASLIVHQHAEGSDSTQE
ncbi:hypothetical protein [Jatrophihabitans sp.]|jgi:hypothetical protein